MGSLGPEILYEADARIQVCQDLAVGKGQRALMCESTTVDGYSRIPDGHVWRASTAQNLCPAVWWNVLS